MSTITEITSVEQWTRHLSSLPPTTLLVASFHAPWAAPCKQMAVVLQTLASEYPAGGGDDKEQQQQQQTSWVSLNAEELSDVSETYDVTAVPFLVLLRGGRVLETVSGSSAVKVREAVERHAARKPGGDGDGASASASASASAGVGAAHADGAANGGLVEKTVDPAKEKEELFKRLEDLVKAAPVMLFMKGKPSAPQCGFSRQLVGILRDNAVKYGFFNILEDDDVRQGLKEYAEWPTYPQLWMDGELVGGLDIVKEELANNADYFKPYSVKSAEGAGA